MSVVPQEGELVVRRIPFDFPDDLDPIWNPAHHEWSQMGNGTSLAMPYLEPFLIATMREAAGEIDDPEVLEEIAGFCAQEGQHFRTHRRYNEWLKSNGYPELARVEEDMREAFDRLREERSLTYRLAYAAGFESMTMGVTKWLVEDRTELFGGADTHVASFWLWHFVEEAEHKRAAYDAYMAARGGYWHRAVGVFTGSMHVFWWARKGTVVLLKKDGRWRDPRSRLRLWLRTAAFFRAIAPGVARSVMPWHDPRRQPDPTWVREWIAGYAAADDDSVPLIDTSDPAMPVPFAPVD